MSDPVRTVSATSPKLPAWLKPGIWVRNKHAPTQPRAFVMFVDTEHCKGGFQYHFAEPFKWHVRDEGWQTGGTVFPAGLDSWEPCGNYDPNESPAEKAERMKKVDAFVTACNLPSQSSPRVGLPLLYNIVCMHRNIARDDPTWWEDFNELMRLADKLLYEQGYEISPYTTNEHQIAADSKPAISVASSTPRNLPRIGELVRELEKREGRRNGTFASGSLALSILEADELLAELRALASATPRKEQP